MFKRFSKRPPRVTSLAFCCFAILLAAGAVALDRLPPVEVTAKVKDKDSLPLLTKDDFKNADPFNLGAGAKKAKVSARFTRTPGDRSGMLYITAKIAEGWHTYAITQVPGGPKRTEINVDHSNDYRLQAKSEFTADPPAKRYFDAKGFEVEVQEHHGEVTWSIPLEFDPKVNLETLRVTGQVELQLCKKQCLNEKHAFSAELDQSQLVAAPPDPLGGGDQFNQFAPPADGKKVGLSASFIAPADGKPGTLTITADIAKGFHIYATTQGKGAGQPTKIKVSESKKFKLPGGFSADPPAEKKFDDIFKVEVQIHHGRVKWTAPFKLPEGADAAGLTIEGQVSLQVCDENSCTPMTIDFAARQAAGKSRVQVGSYKHEGFHGEIHGYIQPGSAQPGETVTLVLTAEPWSKWHIYALADRDTEDNINKPTLIVVEDAGKLKVGATKTAAKPIEHEFSDDVRTYVQHYHERPVTWTTDITIPADAEPGDYPIQGIIGFQTCWAEACDMPLAARFTVILPVGSSGEGQETIPLLFTEAKYGEAAELAAGRTLTQDFWSKTFADLGFVQTGDVWSHKLLSSIEFSSGTLVFVAVVLTLILAFLGGLILNVMPCVLPVIGLKVMSFVEQAGESRGRILGLNLWYSLGVLSVFMVFATVAAVLHVMGSSFGWGDFLREPAFSIPLAAVIFVLALSLMGIWEIPIPGFVGSGKADKLSQQEGPTGAVTKGVITTLLATPCSGPFIGLVVGIAVLAPIWLNFAVFGMMALGMSAPFLLIGMYPRLISKLPKPGAWMETFKQAMGFVLLATVVFIFYFLEESLFIQTLSLMVALGFAAWLIGSTPLTASRSQKLRNRTIAVVVLSSVTMVAFATWKYTIPLVATVDGLMLAGWLIWLSRNFSTVPRKAAGWATSAGVLLLAGGIAYLGLIWAPLPWEPFSANKLHDYREEGYTVLVDFTADW
ncbi:MAG: hypothetical protein IID44_00940 [Planctomycetes bacterium]|nr:hypothetical protein [Planctomycetota bacterium]